jgi:hypothetical protein
MGDADESYDFSETARFVKKFQDGFDLVAGCRLPRGGGKVLPGAMPFIHRWFGNPLFSQMTQRMFAAPIHDVYCGLRGFTRELYDRLELQCEGMEFATEMIIKASLHGARITEIPITLHPDGRKTHAPHLRTVRDGWRTLRFFLVFSPRWLFLAPGILFALLGLTGYAIALPGLTIGGVTFDAHTLLFSSLAIMMGYQSVLFAICAKTFAINEGLLPKDPARRSVLQSDLFGTRSGHWRPGFLSWLDLIGGSRVAVEVCAFRSPRLRRHHALGHSGRNAYGVGLSNDTLKFFCEYPWNEASCMSHSPAETETEFDPAWRSFPV